MSTTARAAVWAFASTAGTRVITLVSLAILARLLAPAEFGLLAFALVYITYAETIGDLGTAVALIYWKDRREDAAQVTFVLNVVMGVLWCLLTLALAPFIADFFNNPKAEPIVRALSLTFIIKFLGNTHDALAQKDLRFRARALPELALSVTKAALSIALAALGFGAWSLVWGQLAGITVWTIGAWLIVPWRPRLAFPRGLLAPMLRYGRGIVAVNIIAAVVHHADLAIVGRMLGATALGLYQLAYKIPEATVTVIIWVVSKVLFPSFAKLGEGEELRSAYLHALTYVSLITVPLAAGLFVAAEPLVRVAFGERWLAAAPLLRWLALYAGIRSIGTHAGDILKATGRTGMLAGFGIVKAAILLPSLIVAARYGVEQVAATLAIVTLITVLINIVIVMRLLHFGPVELGRSLRASALAGAVLLAVALLVEGALRGARAELTLVMLLVVGTLTYAGTLYLVDRRVLTTIRVALGRGRSRGVTS